MGYKKDILSLLQAGKTVQFSPQGTSMAPLIRQGRDFVIVSPLSVLSYNDCKEKRVIEKGDVLLYRSTFYDNTLVIHRVCKITCDGVYFVGDNQTLIEGPVAYGMIYGKMTYFIRKGLKVDVNNLFYITLSRIWLYIRPIRPYVRRMIGRVKKIRRFL